jgi:hypothetical protein
VELADLFNETAEVTADYGKRRFVMQVFTEKLTPEYKAKFLLAGALAADEGDKPENAAVKDELVQMLEDLIDSWKDGEAQDIVLHGAPFLPTYENLAKLSYPVLARLNHAIKEYLGDLANPLNATN